MRTSIFLLLLLFPLSLYADLKVEYTSIKDSFSARFPHDPAVEEHKDTKSERRDYSAAETDKGIIEYKISYLTMTGNEPLSSLNEVEQRQLVEVFYNTYARGFGDDVVELSKRLYEFDGTYPAVDYKLLAFHGNKKGKFIIRGFTVFRLGKVINATLLYTGNTDSFPEEKYQEFIKSIRFK
jgi:hypothetical protein